MVIASSSPLSDYRLDQLGWLQFKRVCSLVLEADAGLSDLGWLGRADSGRVALVDEPPVATVQGIGLAGPVTVVVRWVRDDESPEWRLSELVEGISALPSEAGLWLEDRVLVLTNLDGVAARSALLQQAWVKRGSLVVIGGREIGESLDRHPELRAAMPSVLGLRDLTPLIAPGVRARSTLDLERAQALARVFWPTRAYERARSVLARHRFVVLTGPPEMGKTAIAQMLALAALTDGWEAHECNSPDQVWRAFDRKQRQVFVADDAFGSTEYRADAAERWAQALGRLLGMLDEHHWLIWTSRPAPLKAGLRRVQLERGSERFPAPGEILVDASDLDLAEKTLILFRHAKDRGASNAARKLVRSAALPIVEHPHFTPERIRRFVTDRLDTLPHLVAGGYWRLRLAVERELASPTEAMRTSFKALEDEHRELLIAMLDAPTGLIDERELAATVRRHHAGGLSRPPGELIDRLTDHFLRITPLGIGWVHPSWRDLVIDELREHAAARRRFLEVCGVDGAVLALSQEGGIEGERTLPLLVTDADWDLLADRIAQWVRELQDQDLVRVLLALRDVLAGDVERSQKREARSLAECVLQETRQSWDKHHRTLPVFVVEAWYALDARVYEHVESLPLGATWGELHPGSRLLDELDRSELSRADEWLSLAQTLSRYDLQALKTLRFFDRDQKFLARLIDALTTIADDELRPLAESILARIEELAPDHAYRVRGAIQDVRRSSADERRWWVPEDIPGPPSTERVESGQVEFTRADVDRVLTDL
jgi:hypothetical protein